MKLGEFNISLSAHSQLGRFRDFSIVPFQTRPGIISSIGPGRNLDLDAPFAAIDFLEITPA